MIKIGKEERDAIASVVLQKFEKFKVGHGWALLDENVKDYKEGMDDILDSMVSVFGSYQSIYDIAALRDAIEERIEEADAED